jgi:drug/metabolite transporter (DMT)-like permease
MFYFALFTTLFSFVPALFVWQTPSWTELALLVAAGALGIIGQSMFTHGIGLGETSFVMPFDYLRIVHSFVFGVIFFAEIPGFWSIAGAVVIVASSLYLLRTERKSPRP